VMSEYVESSSFSMGTKSCVSTFVPSCASGVLWRFLELMGASGREVGEHLLVVYGRAAR
jgi:hypothetical protein